MAHDNHAMPERSPSQKYRVIVFRGFRPIGQRFILDSWLAITIYRWIFAWRKLDDAELAHEVTHVGQWRQYGFVGYIRAYMAESAKAKSAGMDRYRDNRFEVEARAAEDAVRRRETPAGH
jgi:hypothetical protein